jgi:hypothetical protein
VYHCFSVDQSHVSLDHTHTHTQLSSGGKAWVHVCPPLQSMPTLGVSLYTKVFFLSFLFFSFLFFYVYSSQFSFCVCVYIYVCVCVSLIPSPLVLVCISLFILFSPVHIHSFLSYHCVVYILSFHSGLLPSPFCFLRF